MGSSNDFCQVIIVERRQRGQNGHSVLHIAGLYLSGNGVVDARIEGTPQNQIVLNVGDQMGTFKNVDRTIG